MKRGKERRKGAGTRWDGETRGRGRVGSRKGGEGKGRINGRRCEGIRGHGKEGRRDGK